MKTTNDFTEAFEDRSLEAYNNAVAHGFYENPPSDLERFALMHEELGEASSWHRHGNPDSDHIAFSGVEEELADVIIRIMDYATYRKLDVAGAIVAKMEFNKSRPYKHGKTC